MPGAHETIEQVARDSYGRLLAIVASRSGDIALAEDCLSSAFSDALEGWPRQGVPHNPCAWLLTAARRSMLDHYRHRSVIENARLPKVEVQLPEEGTAFQDERLKLLFVCTHPAIDVSVRTPLMLQTVLGLDAARIASAFLVSPSTMSQRLVRAKMKIRQAGIPFQVPAPSDLADRVLAVTEAIYAAYGSLWQEFQTAAEALRLAEILADLLPDCAEALGLHALLLYLESRHRARLGATGDYVPLNEQDMRLWDRDLIGRAETILLRAARMDDMGPLQIEAAIQSAHTARSVTGVTDWPSIVNFYTHLVRLAPSIGARVALAAALAECGEPDRALAYLNGIPDAKSYQPYQAARAHVLAMLGEPAPAAEAFDLAIGLSTEPAIGRFLERRKAALGAHP